MKDGSAWPIVDISPWATDGVRVSESPALDVLVWLELVCGAGEEGRETNEGGLGATMGGFNRGFGMLSTVLTSSVDAIPSALSSKATLLIA